MKKLYHPLCHLVNGERLYFIVISFHNDPFNSADLLVEKMKENGLNASSCAHLIFGDMDVILRVWASELIVSDLILYLESNKNIDTYSLKLIENLMPWYSREIEDNGNVFTLSKADIDDILSNKIKDSLIYFYKQNHRDIFSYKFWVIVEEPYSSNSGFYSQFNTKLNGSKKIKDFDGTFNISLYSYMTSTKRGFIFKANTNNFVMSCDKITALIHELSVDNEYKISTYIARKQLKDDEDLVNFGKNPHVPIETRKRKILYNLLKSHDCNKLMFEDDADELDTLETYVDNLLPVFYDIFKYNKDWCEKVRVSRNITKWVVEEKNSMIISFLLREYVTLESKCRGILDSIYVKNASKLKGVPGIARQIQNIGNMSDDKYKEIESIIKKIRPIKAYIWRYSTFVKHPC